MIPQGKAHRGRAACSGCACCQSREPCRPVSGARSSEAFRIREKVQRSGLWAVSWTWSAKMGCLRASQRAVVPPFVRTAEPLHFVCEVHEAGVLAHEGELDVARGAVAVLRHDEVGCAQVRTPVLLGLDLVHRAIDEHDDVGVLLDGARLSQVGKLRALLATHLDGT